LLALHLVLIWEHGGPLASFSQRIFECQRTKDFSPTLAITQRRFLDNKAQALISAQRYAEARPSSHCLDTQFS